MIASKLFTQNRGVKLRIVVILVIFVGALGALTILARPLITVKAAPVLSITPVTWNVLGLDDTNLSNGPNEYPVGVRVCNSGDSAATNLEITFTWDSINPYINLIGSDKYQTGSIGAQTCKDYYYNVRVNRDELAKNSSRSYHISASADGITPISTPTPQELYVKPIKQKTNNSLSYIIGPSNVIVGQSVQYVFHIDALQNYQQVMNFINFPYDKFRVHSIAVSYGQPANVTFNKVHADACGWDNTPGSSTYLTCIGPQPAEFPNGTAGGSLSIIYTVEIIAEGTSVLGGTLYGYSENEYSYIYSPALIPVTVNAVNQATQTSTSTLTSTTSSTSTGTATITGTPPTSTATATATVTGTPPTSTATFTGTPPTPTATGTITPAMNITKEVSTTTVRPGQSLSFTIKVSNTGLAPATEVKVTDTFQSVLSLSSVSTTKGTYTVNSSTRTVTIDLGEFLPNQSATITVVAKVNTSATTTSTYSNFAKLDYKFGETTYSKNSNTVSYKVEITSTLPGTGLAPLNDPPSDQSDMFLIILYTSIILAVVGLLSLLFGFGRKRNNPQWGGWLITIGVFLIFAGIFFGLLASSINQGSDIRELFAFDKGSNAEKADSDSTWYPTQEGPWILLPSATELDSLPDFPIPTPDPDKIAESGEKYQDITPVERISIPSIEVDTIVKFVPFKRNNWLISGLKQEVAWMGDTSWPGLGGNTALAGHITLNDGSDGPFRYLEEVKIGDLIRLYSEENIYTYKIRELRIVEDNDLSILAQTNYPQLTLITCTKWDRDVYMYLNRVIVLSDLVDIKPIYQNQESY